MFPLETALVQYDRLVSGLAVVFGTITVVMAVLGAVYNPVILFVALTFGVATYFVYYHASGRMAASVYRRVERQAARNGGEGPRRGQRGGFGAGPREEWTPPRDGATAREAGAGGRRRSRRRGRERGSRQQRTRYRQRAPRTTGEPTAAAAYRTLDLEPGADEATIKRAYREKVKSVHPDADGGDEEAFKAVTAAYEQLTD